jgi:tRNA-5-methyluridine54 2-sulfurtransferase
MKCKKCSEPAVMEDSKLCRNHFIFYFERKVKQTILDFDLLNKKDKVCVAVSGGKDSTVLLYLLKKFGYAVEALAIDEGIAGYREKTLDFLEKFCRENNIKLVIKEYRTEIGKRLDNIIRRGEPACTICGTFRRHVLNKYSSAYDKIATGHNLDDESQAVLMNLMKAQVELFDRQGPKSGKIAGFTQKIKPLYFLKEKEILAYSFLMGFGVPFVECPFARDSFRNHVGEELNKYEELHPGAKRNIVLHYLKSKRLKHRYLKTDSGQRSQLEKCERCGFPSSGRVCKACRLKEVIMNS